MADPLSVPTAEAFRKLITMLVGRHVTARPTPPLATSAVRGVATYVDPAGVVVYVAAMDVAFIASVGAALAMFPVAIATEAIRAGKPSDALVENAFEVLNVAAGLFNDVEDTTVHVRAERLLVGPVAAAQAAHFVKPRDRIDLDVAVPGYANGKICFLVVGGG